MSRARELAKAGGVQQRIVGLSSHVGVSTFAADVEMYQDLTVAGNLNVTGDLSYDETTATNQRITGVTTTKDLVVTQNVNVSGMQSVGAGASTTALDVSGHIIPREDDTFDLGSPTRVWRDVYIGPGSLYVNGQKVLQEDSSNIIVSCDENQNLVFQTSGSGDLELDPTGTGIVQVKGTLQIEDGTNITNSAGNAITFGSAVAANSLISRTTNSNLALSGNGNGNVVVNDDLTVNGSLTVDGGNIDINTNGITATTISASGITTSTGGFVGNLTGNVTGNVTGDLTGDSAGTHTGAVVGNVTGDTAGTHTGSVVGNVTGNLTGNVASSGANLFGSAIISGETTIGAGLTVSGNAIIAGNLTVNGTQTVINSTTLTVDDKTVELGSVDTPSDSTANAGGVILKGATDHTLLWYNDNDHWESSEHFNLVSGKSYQIADTAVLSATTLGSGVVNSSLTTVGTISSGTWQGTAIANAYLANSSISIGGVSLSLGDTDSTPAFNGSDITAINASNIASGTLSDDRLPSTITKNISGGTVSCTTLSASGSVTLGDSSSDTVAFNGVLSTDLIPNANGTLDLGASGTRFANVFSSDLDLSNEAKGVNTVDGTWGSYLIEEGEEHLYITNRRSGKKFRFMLEEV